MTAPRPRNPLRSAAAVVAGFLLTAALSIGVDAALHAAGIYPPWGQPMSDGLFGLATAYRVVFTVLGGWLTARLAPSAPMRHAAALGIAGALVALVGVAATWNGGPQLGPRWYPLALFVTALPSVLLGGRLGSRGRAAPGTASAAR